MALCHQLIRRRILWLACFDVVLNFTVNLTVKNIVVYKLHVKFTEPLVVTSLVVYYLWTCSAVTNNIKIISLIIKSDSFSSHYGTLILVSLFNPVATSNWMLAMVFIHISSCLINKRILCARSFKYRPVQTKDTCSESQSYFETEAFGSNIFWCMTMYTVCLFIYTKQMCSTVHVKVCKILFHCFTSNRCIFVLISAISNNSKTCLVFVVLFSVALPPLKLLTYIKRHFMHFNPLECFLCFNWRSMKPDG